MNYISYLNMHRSRLGYVNCVLLMADVQLDSPLALRRRFDEFIFQPVFEDSAGFADFKALLRAGALEELDRQVAQRGRRPSKRTRRGIVPEAAQRGPRVFDLGDLWLLQTSMRSHVGRIPREYSNEPIELAKELGLLSPGYALTEFAHMLKLFVIERVGEHVKAVPSPNPLAIYEDIPLRLLYLFTLLRADVVFAALLGALAREWDLDGALRRALEDLTGRIESEMRLDAVGEAKGLFLLRERIKKKRPTGEVGTEKPVDKAQRVPRFEFCVDLGFMERQGGAASAGREEGTYRRTRALELVPRALATYLERPTAAVQWLDREFFKAAGIIYEHELRPCEDPDLKLFYFVKGSSFLKRRVGFIPGRIAAMIGCLFAWLDGYRLEIADLFNEVYKVPKGKWSAYMQFSGGSRLDSEFLVVVDQTLESKLQSAVHTSRNG
jgi:hypothetical protein